MQGTPAQKGIIPRAFEHIFEAVASDTSKKYLIRASYLEIYNENIRDLIGKDYKLTLDLHVFNKTTKTQQCNLYKCKYIFVNFGFKGTSGKGSLHNGPVMARVQKNNRL